MGRSRSRSRSRGRRSGGSRRSERSKKRSKRSRSRSRDRGRKRRGGDQSPGSGGSNSSFDANAVKAALAAMDSKQNLVEALNQAMAADPTGAMAAMTQAVSAGLTKNQPNNVPIVTASPMLASQKQQTRAARRIYVGNLPAGIGLNETMLIEFFSSSLKQFGMATEKPIMAATMRLDQSFCFLEFRKVPDVDIAMQLLQGLSLGASVLKVAKPSDWAAAPDDLQDFEVPLDHAVATMAQPAVNPFVDLVAPVPVAAPVAQATYHMGPKYPFHPNSLSNVVVLVDIVLTQEEALNPSDVVSDIHWECVKYGVVKSVTFPPDLKEQMQAQVAVDQMEQVQTQAADVETSTEAPTEATTEATTEAEAEAPEAESAPPAAMNTTEDEAVSMEAKAEAEAEARAKALAEVPAAEAAEAAEAAPAEAPAEAEAEAPAAAEAAPPGMNTTEDKAAPAADATVSTKAKEATEAPTQEAPTQEAGSEPATATAPSTEAPPPAEAPAAETPAAEAPAAEVPAAPQRYQATNCFITFENMKSAGCALLALRKRAFNLRHLNSRFFNAEAYQKGDLSLTHLVAEA